MGSLAPAHSFVHLDVENIKLMRRHFIAFIDASVAAVHLILRSQHCSAIDRDLHYRLATQLISRYEEAGGDERLEEPIDILRALLRCPELQQEQRIQATETLARALTLEHSRSGIEDALINAKQLSDSAMFMRKDLGLDSVMGLGLRAMVLTRLWITKMMTNDVVALELESCLSGLRQYVSSPECAGRASTLMVLSRCLAIQGMGRKDFHAVDAAVLYARDACKRGLALSSATSHHHLGNLALILHRRFSQVHADRPELDESITLFQRVIEMRTDIQPPLRYESYYALALLTRYEKRGSVDDLDEAIRLVRAYIGTHAENSLHVWHNRYVLGVTLWRRFERYGAHADFDEALQCAQQCYKSSRADQSRAVASISMICDLYSISLVKQRRLGMPYDVKLLIEACDAGREHLAMQPPGTLHRYEALSYLARFLNALGSLTRSRSLLKEAAQRGQEALRLCAAGYTNLAEIHNIMADTMQELYDLVGDVAYIDTAIEHRCMSLKISSTIPAAYATFCVGLAEDYHARFKAIQYRQDLVECMQAYSNAIDHPYSSILDRLGFIRRSLAIAKEADDTHFLTKAYQRAMTLLPRIAYRGINIRHRLEALKSIKDIQTLAVDAAMHALSIDQPRLAVENVEHGRAILWNGVLELRTPFEGLPSELSLRLREVSRILYEAEMNESQNVTEGEASRLRKLVDEFERLVEEARASPGFERFLLPPGFEHLRKAASGGPVVLLITTEVIAHGIVIPSDSSEPYVVPLPDAGIARVSQWSRTLSQAQRATRSAVDGEYQGSYRDNRILVKHRNMTVKGLSQVLQDLWTDVVDPILKSLKLPQRRGEVHARPRLWWCPTGEFAFLPLHAAGTASGLCTSDFVVSSYIPSLSVLVEARRQRQVSSADAYVLLVAQPNVPGVQPLPMAAREVSQLAAIHPQHRLVCIDKDIGDADSWDAVTVDVVREAIQKASVVHLACHAKQDKDDPLSSGFVLNGGSLTIADIARARMPRAFFAFLSACESAAGDECLPDAIVHLAGSMLFAGFKSVVGTMWEMYDVDGPAVATEVHQALVDGGYRDPSFIPRALDSAIRKLRESGLPPERWATYTHMGI